MADPRHQPEQEDEHEGAKPSELLIEAARRNNTDLLQEVIDSAGGPEKAAVLLNETKTVMGNYIYHEAASRGNYEIIDMLLDQEGFECDPLSRIEGDTPLHSAIRYINTLPRDPSSALAASQLLSMMIDAGSDPRVRNRALLTPYALTDPTNTAVRHQLQDAVDIVQNQGDYIVDGDAEGRGGWENGGDGDGGEDLPDDYAGSASDSDFDPEEYKRERERQKGEERRRMNGGMI